jgi:hypothetical protein
LALRLANTLSGGVAGILPDMNLVLEEKNLILEMAPDATDLIGEAVMRQLDAVAKNLGRTADLRVTAKALSG